jgi:hypothetical protein
MDGLRLELRMDGDMNLCTIMSMYLNYTLFRRKEGIDMNSPHSLTLYTTQR